MSVQIVTKNSATAGSEPAANALVQGELAVNVKDRKLYSKDADGNVFEFGPQMAANTLQQVTDAGNTTTNNIGTGAITANGDVKIGGTASNPNASILASGSATFIRNIVSGAWDGTGNAGIGSQLSSNGAVFARRAENTSSTSALFGGYKGTNRVAYVSANGKVELSDGARVGGDVKIGGTAANPQIELDATGSAVFKGTVTALGGTRIGANDDAHQIDDYEEGEWTPAFAQEGGNTFNGLVEGTYIKVGDVAFAAFTLKYDGSSNLSDDTQIVKITGFPFVIKSASQVQEIPFFVDNRSNGNTTFAAYGNNTTGYRGVIYSGEIRLFNLDTGAPVTWADVKPPKSGPTPAFKGAFTLPDIQ